MPKKTPHIFIKARGWAGLVLALLVCLALPQPAPAQNRGVLDAPQSAAAGERRVALVIGNGAYKNWNPLTNPVNDAKDMALVLAKLGFEVITGTDLGKTEMEQKIIDFGEALKAGGVGLFYFAGHGQQVDGENYLIPVDALFRTSKYIRADAVGLSRVLAEMEEAKNRYNVLILDACRNNKLPQNGRSAPQGLAPVTPPGGTIIAFATRAGKTASDGKDGSRNSPYTGALLKHLLRPGLSLIDVFMETRKSVIAATGGVQVPVEYNMTVVSFYPLPGEQAKPPEKGPRAKLDFGYLVITGLSPVDASLRLDGRQAGPGSYKVSPGPHRIEARAQFYKPHAETVNVKAGEAVERNITLRLDSGSSPARVFTNSLRMKFVLIPAGSFWLGSKYSPEKTAKQFGGKPDWYRDEQPRKRVTISKPFYLQTTEVTRRQWKAVMGSEPWKGKSHVKSGCPRCPAVYVSWHDAMAFIRKLSDRDGVNYMLPTEAQWEYAARAGSTTFFSFGDDAGELGKYAWFKKTAWDAGEKYAHAVAGKKPNRWGLFDMHGNVWEWVRDLYGRPGGARVVRGGGWHHTARYCRSANRNRYLPAIGDSDLGFRLALEQ